VSWGPKGQFELAYRIDGLFTDLVRVGEEAGPPGAGRDTLGNLPTLCPGPS